MFNEKSLKNIKHALYVYACVISLIVVFALFLGK